MGQESRPVLFSILFILFVSEVVVLISYPAPLKEQLKEKSAGPGNYLSFDRPLIVLHKGASPDSGNSYDTAFWSGWGSENQNMKDNIITKPLPWAAEGISVTKSCDVSCYVSNSQSLLGTADAVMMEIINHPRVFGDGAIKWPKKKPGQLWGMFFYEPYQNHQHFLTPEVVDKFDFKATSSQDSELPITLICPWGRSFDAYLHPPPTKRTDAAICDFSPAIASQYQPFFEELHKNIEVHAYAGQLKNREPSQPYNLKTRLREVGKYKFAIVSEYVIENDYISPELSQAWLAGAVPIYLGAPNVDDFVPGENSIIKASDFASGKELADFIHSLLEDEDKYYSYLAWKDKELSPSFRRHLENCAHLAECRICHYVIEQQALAAQQ